MRPTILVPCLAMLLSGCVTTAIVGGAAAGSAAFDERSLGQHLDDVALTARIKARLIAEKDLPSRWISVEVINGRATLTGFLPRRDQIDRAVYIAHHTEGITSVVSEIKLGKPKLRDVIRDSWITSQVKAKLLDDPVTSGFSIHVETVRGKVYLQGVVKDEVERRRAQELALSVPGVGEVDNRLLIKSP